MELEELSNRLMAWPVGDRALGERVTNFRQFPGDFSQMMYAFDMYTSRGVQNLVLRASGPEGQSITAMDRFAEWEIVAQDARRLRATALRRLRRFERRVGLSTACSLGCQVDIAASRQ
jgi:hypothetical protein